ncbi:hypothetical protein SDC9_167567 [bioreactor metagenome]|uniref:Uncharacterized protein n=1 Tax=bioreactor metagenome TaxID=1076179 RepID=A0A645G304_9ZZZZ
MSFALQIRIGIVLFIQLHVFVGSIGEITTACQPKVFVKLVFYIDRTVETMRFHLTHVTTDTCFKSG